MYWILVFVSFRVQNYENVLMEPHKNIENRSSAP